MKKTLLWLCLGCIGLAQAQTYRWVDEQGRVHYGDRPPPAGKAQERKPMAPPADRQPSYALRQAQEYFPVTLYVSENCGSPCQEAADLLGRRGIPFSRKNVASAEDVAALGKLTGGEAAVPVLQVGAKVRQGFEAAGWNGLLDAAGYPKAP